MSVSAIEKVHMCVARPGTKVILVQLAPPVLVGDVSAWSEDALALPAAATNSSYDAVTTGSVRFSILSEKV